MFYGFDKTTKKCLWSIDTKPAARDNIVVIEDSKVLYIGNIQLSEDGTAIIDRVISGDEIKAVASAKKKTLLAEARDQIDLLTDVVEYGDDESASDLLVKWREYRATLYSVDTTADEVIWPTVPEKQ